jgi:2-phosphosulfolactate phosphatase
MIYNQAEYNIRCEWGEKGVLELAPVSDVVIIIDVLSFSTSVEIATNQNVVVFPYRWKDETSYSYAKSVEAQVADDKNVNGFKLSPMSLQNLPADLRLVLPSPNGSTLSLSTGPTWTLLGSLRNCEAVARSAMAKGRNIAVIPAGERWEDNTLRPCFEDLVGAGAIIRYLEGKRSPEAMVAATAFESASSNLHGLMSGCISGKEKIDRHEEGDIRLASDINASACVPILTGGAFIKESTQAGRQA